MRKTGREWEGRIRQRVRERKKSYGKERRVRDIKEKVGRGRMRRRGGGERGRERERTERTFGGTATRLREV